MSSEFEQYVNSDFVTQLHPKEFATFVVLEHKQDKCPLETPLDFEEDVFDDDVQRNEAIPLSDEEIALDVNASSEGTLSPGGPRSGWMSFSKRPGKNTPECYTKPLDSFKNWNNRFLWVDERVFPTVVDWRTSAPKDGMPAENTYSAEAVRILDTHRTPIQKQPEALLCLVGLSRKYYLGDEVYPTFLHDDDRGGYGTVQLNPRSQSHKEMEDPAAATDSSGVPSTIERSPLDFANEAGAAGQGTIASEVPPPEDVPTTRGAPEAGQEKGVAATDPSAVIESRKRGHDGADANAPPRSAPADVSDSDLLSFADPRSRHPADVAQSSQGTIATGDPDMLDTPEACQDLVDHVAPPGYFSELRHLHNDDFLRQYNVNLARQVAMGSQPRLRLEQEAKLLKKSVAQVARRDKKIQAREHEIKNLEALLEAEADIKKAAEYKNAKLSQELDNMRALFSNLQVSNDHLSQQVATLQEQVSGEKKLKAAFEEFKQYEDNRVEQRCAEMDARLDALSIDFDEELYPHMLTAIADAVSTRIAKGMSEGLRHGVEHGRAQLDLEALEAYDPEAEAKYTAALQVLKNLKYPLVDQLEGLKNAPMDVIMAALHLESDTGDDAPQWVRDLRPVLLNSPSMCTRRCVTP
nr:hypothetical protein [Tanacetum cinerariifolium]